MPTTQLDQDSKNRLTDIKKAIYCNIEEVSRSIEIEESLLNQMIDLLQSRQRVPNIIRVNGSGTIPDVVYSFSVYNSGSVNGNILGETIKPGERLSFSAGTLNNFYASGSISYDGTGTELLIIYNS